VDKLWKLAAIDASKQDPVTKKSTPPICEFRWGSTWSFKVVVTSISAKFELFLGDGTPTRATVDLGLKQAQDTGLYPSQNPTSGGAAGHRRHTVTQRETLDLIAAREYGEPRHWRFIARANGIDNPLDIYPGMVLALPPLEA
jgi:nucleoid-associated protein YgaU